MKPYSNDTEAVIDRYNFLGDRKGSEEYYR